VTAPASTPAPRVAEVVDDARFSLRLRGYDTVEVDDLLDAIAVMAAALDARVESALAGVPPAMPDQELVDLISDVSTRTFRQVRKGDDPHEVYEALARIESAIQALALRPPAVADPVSLAEGRAAALVAGAQAEAARISRRALAEVPVDRWLDRSGAAGTVLQRARQEGDEVRRHAVTHATRIRQAAAEERAAAAAERAEAEAAASRLVADAATEAGGPGEDPTEAVLAAAEVDLARIEQERAAVRAELEAVRSSVALALAAAAPAR